MKSSTCHKRYILYIYSMIIVLLIVINLGIIANHIINRSTFYQVINDDFVDYINCISTDSINCNTMMGSTTWVGTYDGKIYFCPLKDNGIFDFDYMWVHSIEGNKVVKLAKIHLCSNDNYFGQIGRYMYYCNQLNGSIDIYCYDLKSSLEIRLISVKGNIVKNPILLKDGRVFIPYIENCDNEKNNKKFVSVYGTEVSIIDEPFEVFNDGKMSYCLIPDDNKGFVDLICIDSNLETIIDTYDNRYYDAYLYPVSDGILFLNHKSTNVVDFVDFQNTVSSLLQVDGMVCRSSFACNDIYLAVSLLVYEGFDEEWHIFLKRTSEESQEGTYLFSLENMSCYKISNNVFCGMYFVNRDEMMCSCNNQSIYYLSTSGKCVEVIRRTSHMFL